jgi:hypothetical protein
VKMEIFGYRGECKDLILSLLHSKRERAHHMDMLSLRLGMVM